MDYISYLQVEELLRKYPALKALLNNMQIELEKLWRNRQNSEISEEDILYSLSIGNRVLSDMPHVASNSDKILGIIEKKDRIINGEYVKEIIQAINVLGEVVEKTTIALKSLSSENQKILTEFYCEGKTWGEISSVMNLEKMTLKNRRKEAIEQILGILRVTREQHKFCVEQLERKEN